MLLASILLLLVCTTKIFAAPTAHQPGEEYTVVLDPAHPQQPEVSHILERISLHPTHQDVRHVYNNTAFRGFSAKMQSHCIDALRNMSEVAVVEKAIPMRSSTTARVDAPWGLQRISTAYNVPGNGDGLTYTYTYGNSGLGQGADIYIVDTGIYTEHTAFNGRAEMLFSFDGNFAGM